MSLLFLFWDGLGLAPAGEHNPLAHASMPFFKRQLSNGLLADSQALDATLLWRALDAQLETAGLPQSATGQSSLLTGRNAAAFLGRHYGPQPAKRLKGFLDEGTLFSQLHQAGKRCWLSNFYPASYHEKLHTGSIRPNAIVYAAQQAGLGLADAEDYKNFRAISADLTGEHASHRAILPPTSPYAMGKRLAEVARGYDFTFFDGWITDIAGHRWHWQDTLRLLHQVDDFCAGVHDHANDMSIIMTSDHGNIEAKDSKSHSYNPVPLLVWGEASQYFEACSSLVDVAPAIRRYFQVCVSANANSVS